MNFPSVDILAIDLDGTLLNSKREVSAENRSAIRTARLAGIRVLLASGRMGISVQEFQDSLGISDEPLIASNGSEIFGPDRVPVSSKFLHQKAKMTILELARHENVHLNAYTQNELLFLEDDEWGDIYLRRVKNVPRRLVSRDQLSRMKLVKIIIVAPRARIQSFYLQHKAKIEDSGSKITESEPDYLEFLHPGVNKGSALKKLAKEMSIPRHRTAAIGDYLNDLEMIEWAGCGAVVKNGLDEVKAKADVLAPSNDDHGVAWLIHQLIRAKNSANSGVNQQR